MASVARSGGLHGFQSELEELGIELEEEEGRRAALQAAADKIWRDQLGPLLTTRQVCTLTGTTKQAVSELARRKRLLALPTRQGPPLFPAFQFSRGGRALTGIADVIAIFDPVVENSYLVASFLTGEQPELERKTPAAWLRSGRPVDAVLTAARRAAAALER